MTLPTEGWGIFDEDTVFADALVVTSEEDLLAAFSDGTQAVVITADITLSEAAEQTVPVRIAEGVTVTALGSAQTLADDGSLTASDEEQEACTWTVGMLLVNYGTLQGEISEDETDGWIINHGTIGAEMRFDNGDNSVVLLSLNDAELDWASGMWNDLVFMNLGTMTHIPVTDSDDGSLYLYADMYNSGSILFEGGYSDSTLDNDRGAMLKNRGTMMIGDGGRLVNKAYIENRGDISAIADGAYVENRGVIYVDAPYEAFGGLLDFAPYDVTYGGDEGDNTGCVIYSDEEHLNLPDGWSDCLGTLIRYDWWANVDGCREVSTEEELRSALESDSCDIVVVTEDISVDGDLTIEGKSVGGCGISISGNLTVTDAQIVECNVELTNGGTVTISGDSYAVINLGGESGDILITDESTLLLAGDYYCSGVQISLQDEAHLICPGYLDLKDRSLLTIGTEDGYGKGENHAWISSLSLDDTSAVQIYEEVWNSLQITDGEISGSVVNYGKGDFEEDGRIGGLHIRNGLVKLYGTLENYGLMSVEGTLTVEEGAELVNEVEESENATVVVLGEINGSGSISGVEE